PGNPIVYDLDVQTFLRHTNASNLDITLRSPQGTVVTLTSDNGGANDDVFNGTVWDDDANPGGQVPYVSNDGLATDHGYANATLASPLAPEEALGAFNGENPNGTWTLTISDDTVGDGGALDAWSLRLATIAANAPSETQQFFSATGLPLPLSDPGPNPPPLRTKTITVSGAGSFISKVKVSTSIMHSNNADLDITIQSPQGTVVTLTT